MGWRMGTLVGVILIHKRRMVGVLMEVCNIYIWIIALDRRTESSAFRTQHGGGRSGQVHRCMLAVDN